MNCCETCGQSLRKYSVPLSKGIVQALVKFRTAVVNKNENKIHLQHDITLTKNEYNNFQKLRYHALVAKYKENGEHVAGYWLLTRRGGQFLRGEIDIPKLVEVYNNKVVGYSQERVFLKDVYRQDVYFEHIEDIKYEEATEQDIEKKLDVIKKSKRRKNPCPNCDGELKIQTESTWIAEKQVYRVDRSKVCLKCGFKTALDNVK